MATDREGVTDIRPWLLGPPRKQLCRPWWVEQISFFLVLPVCRHDFPCTSWLHRSSNIAVLRQAGPLIWIFGHFSLFLQHGREEVERHLLWKFYKKLRRKSSSNMPPKLLACIMFLYKVVHKIGRLRKFNRSGEIEFNFLTAWANCIKFGTLVQHAPGYKILPHPF